MRFNNLLVAMLGLSIWAGFWSTSAATANEVRKAAPEVTEFGDGIQLIEPADHTGFVMSGGGGRFTYDYNARMLTVEYEGNQRTVLHFDD